MKLIEDVNLCSSCFWNKWKYCFAFDERLRYPLHCNGYVNRQNEIETLDHTLMEWMDRGEITEEEINEIKKGLNYDD